MTRISHLPARSCASATRCSRCRSRWRARCWRRAQSPLTWPTVGWILVAMVAARSAAMGFNRLVDARFDALNPRTANRELPRGAMSVARGGARSWRSRRPCSSSPPGGSNPLCFAAVAGRAGDRVLVLAGQALHDLDAALSRPGDGGGAGRRMAGGRRARRLGAVAARRWRSAPGSAASTCCTPARTRVRSRARSAVDSGALRRAARRSRISRVMHVVPSSCLRRWPGSTPLPPFYYAGVGVRGAAARVRAVARARRRPVAGQARVRPERLRRHPLSARAGGVRLCPLTTRATVGRDRHHRRERRDLRHADAGRAARARRARRARGVRLRPAAAARRARRARRRSSG